LVGQVLVPPQPKNRGKLNIGATSLSLARCFSAGFKALLLIGLLCLAPLHTARAQAAPVEIGKAFTGEFKPDQLQLSYAFKGKAGEWLLVEFRLAESTVKRAPTFRIRLEADDILNTGSRPAGEVSEALLQVPKDADYVLDVLPPPGDNIGTFVARIVRPAPLNNGQAVNAAYAPEPNWYLMASNGPFTLDYATADAGGLKPLVLSGLIGAGSPSPAGYLKFALSTENTVNSDPDFGTFNRISVAFNPKPANAYYLIRVGGTKPGNYGYTLLRTDGKR
jgi:hypothetical protein